MATILYDFDGEYFRATPEGEQDLLVAINDALTTEAYGDPDNTPEQAEEAVSMSYDGTNVSMAFWDNIMAIMQQAPYQIDVRRVDSETATEEEKEFAE